MNKKIKALLTIGIFLLLFGLKLGAENKSSQEKLVNAFVAGLIRGSEFEEVQHLFLSVDDFSELVKALRQGEISNRDRHQLNGKKNLKIQRREMQRQIKRRIVGPWKKLTSSLKNESTNIRYNDYHSETIVKNGITSYRFALEFVVNKNGNETQVKRTIKVMNLGGKLKIVQLFKPI